jgi:hypothetical protein
MKTVGFLQQPQRLASILWLAVPGIPQDVIACEPISS